MIVSLRGKLIASKLPNATIECNGVGYEVMMPTSSFAQLPEIGKEVYVYTAMVVKEDSHSLFAFLSEHEKNVFNILIKISGVGAKSAIALLSALDPTSLGHAVDNNDIKMLTRAPGIGKKNAERIIIELRGKQILFDSPAVSPKYNQAVEGLIALGYSAANARTALAKISDKELDVAGLIKQALVELTSKNI